MERKMKRRTQYPEQRLPAKNVYYYRCPDHRRNYVMSFAFCFDREDDVYQFAYCYPYTYSRLQHYLSSLEQRNLDYLKREQLGLSVTLNNDGLQAYLKNTGIKDDFT
ncbi:cytosolic carboxypeptidase 6 isoform X1 [Tachysurus ichikawai]